MEAVSRIKTLRTNSLALILFLLCHLWRAPLDPDPLHDGLMYASAVAVSNGLTPHLDFFSQYGPTTHLIHGTWLSMTQATVFALRILNSFLLTLISFLLFSLLKKRFSVKTSILVSVLWSISSPTILPADIPWPSVVSTLLLMLAIWVVSSDGYKEYGKLFFVGLLISITLFIRIHNLIIPLIVLCLCLASRKMYVFKHFLNGFGLGLITYTLWLLSNSSFTLFFEQVILWPLKGHTQLDRGIKVWLVHLFLVILIPFFTFLFIQINRFSKTSTSLATAISFTTLITLLLYSWDISEIPTEEKSLRRNPVFLTKFLAQESRNTFSYICIGLFILALYGLSRSLKSVPTKVLLTAAIALGSLTQLFPSPDSYHMWWIAPIPIVAASSVIDYDIEIPLLPLILPLVVVNVIASFWIASEPRMPAQSKALQGMYILDNSIDEALLALEKYVPPNSARFFCHPGLYAANPNGFLSNHRLFVSWPKGITDNLSDSYQFIVLCSTDEMASREGLNKIWQNSAITIFERIQN